MVSNRISLVHLVDWFILFFRIQTVFLPKFQIKSFHYRLGRRHIQHAWVLSATTFCSCLDGIRNWISGRFVFFKKLLSYNFLRRLILSQLDCRCFSVLLFFRVLKPSSNKAHRVKELLAIYIFSPQILNSRYGHYTPNFFPLFDGCWNRIFLVINGVNDIFGSWFGNVLDHGVIKVPGTRPLNWILLFLSPAWRLYRRLSWSSWIITLGVCSLGVSVKVCRICVGSWKNFAKRHLRWDWWLLSFRL